MENLQTKPRAVLLYRASSKKQTDSENDIPLQRNILKPWVERQGYTFVKELVEGGVSGFKVSADDRDAIQEIKRMADRREFDILGIYMSDRLGRIAAETPLIVSYLNARGIKVISYSEGEITANTHADKLMTYIRYWQAEGESLKTSARVADAGEQSVRQGKWRGGCAPYGYRSVSRGTLNYKGKPIFDVEIDPERAEVIKTVFRLYCTENYGSKGIAKHLNDKGITTSEGGLWNSSLILKILKNKLYYGVYELGKITKREKVESPVMPHLAIITQEEFDKAQEILKKNKIVPDTVNYQRPTQHGALLLTGLLFCGECGRKYTTNRQTAKRVRKDGTVWEYEQYRYRCSSYYTPMERKETCHQTIYRADVLEGTVIQKAKVFVREKDKDELMISHKTQTQKMLDEVTARYEKAESALNKKEKEIAKLKEEIMKTLLGESNFSQETLSDMLKTKEAEYREIAKTVEDGQAEIMQLDQTLNMQLVAAQDLQGWAERFDSQPTAIKKSMLINIIDRIEVQGEDIDIFFKRELYPLSNLTLVKPKNILNNDGEHQNGAYTSENSAISSVNGYPLATLLTL